MTDKLFKFIAESPTSFHTVEAIKKRLDAHGFTALKENEHWKLSPSHKYYVIRNSSSIIAFDLSSSMPTAFKIVASHSDFPSFKLKENNTVTVKNKYVKLNTEGYGGMINYSWLDRPLSVAGRLVIKDNNSLSEKLVNIDRDLVIIPSLAIHMNRKVNDGIELNKQIDMLPLFAQNSEDTSGIVDLICDEYSINKDNVLGHDLFLYNRMSGSYVGASKEYICAPRLDDLMCAYSSLEGFLESESTEAVKIYACFDNEEVGSSTINGAASSFLSDTVKRLCNSLSLSEEQYHIALANSIMLSEDNGHAVHPNHPEKTDSENCIFMNDGVVIKSQAGKKYSTDALGSAICKDICKQNDIPIQFFANRSDEAGGSTLGSIASCRLPVMTIDIGLAQLAMHSSYETAGAYDLNYMIRFNKAFFEYR